MGHGVGGEERGGMEAGRKEVRGGRRETIVSSVASVYISANTGGWWLILASAMACFNL